MAEDGDDPGLVSFDELASVGTMRAEDAPRGSSPAANEEDSFGSATSEGRASPAPTMMRSVLTRKPSVAALKAMLMSERDEEGAGEGSETDEDEGVCSLSEFAMVLNAAAWDDASVGALGVEVIVKQLELLRGKIAPEASLSSMLGFDLAEDLSVRANSAGMVSVGAIGNVLYRGLSRSRSVATISSDRERFEDILDRRAVKNISKVLGGGDEDAIITSEDLKAKLDYYGVRSSMTDIISIMTQADIESTGVVKVGDLSRLLARELEQLRGLLDEKVDNSKSERFRVSLDIERDGAETSNSLLKGQATFGVLQRFPTARKDRQKPGRLVWAKDDEMCAVCLFDRSGTMMVEEQGQLIDLPTKLDYFTDVARDADTRTIVHLPAPPPQEQEKKKGGFASFFCCFSA